MLLIMWEGQEPVQASQFPYTPPSSFASGSRLFVPIPLQILYADLPAPVPAKILQLKGRQTGILDLVPRARDPFGTNELKCHFIHPRPLVWFLSPSPSPGPLPYVPCYQNWTENITQFTLFTSFRNGRECFWFKLNWSSLYATQYQFYDSLYIQGFYSSRLSFRRSLNFTA